MEFKHVSVLKNECIEGLQIKSSGTYVDGTFGGGGHAMEVISRLNGNGRFIGIDQDQDAVENGRAKLEPYKEKAQLVRDNFSNIIFFHTEQKLICIFIKSFIIIMCVCFKNHNFSHSAAFFAAKCNLSFSKNCPDLLYPNFFSSFSTISFTHPSLKGFFKPTISTRLVKKSLAESSQSFK